MKNEYIKTIYYMLYLIPCEHIDNLGQELHNITYS